MKASASLLLTASVAAAQSSIVTVFLPGFDPKGIQASVVSAAPSATTYHLNCAPDTAADECGLADGVDLVYGPSTFAYKMSFGPETITAHCDLDFPNDKADCTAIDVSDGTTSTEIDTVNELTSYLQTITVTAGAGITGSGTITAPFRATSATAPTNTASSGAAETSGADSGAADNSSSAGGASSSGSGSGSGTSAAATSTTHTGGMPQITQNAVLVGAAALVGGALLM